MNKRLYARLHRAIEGLFQYGGRISLTNIGSACRLSFSRKSASRTATRTVPGRTSSWLAYKSLSISLERNSLKCSEES